MQVLETLVRLKKNDPLLKQPDVVLFPKPADSEEGEEDGQQAAEGGKKSKPMYLRTVLAKQVGTWSDSRKSSCSSSSRLFKFYSVQKQQQSRSCGDRISFGTA
jgi:hypothetical protein